MSDKPLIGITKPERGDNLAFAAIKLAVRLAGGKPLKMTPGMSWRDCNPDGLILGGGSDVFPEHYDKAAIDGAHYDLDRDEMGMYWARKARDSGIPTLGICRGAQVMNVASGGSLYQSLGKVYEIADYPTSLWGHAFFRKKILIRKGSLLYRLIGRYQAPVNSIHKQAVAELGKDLTVTANEENGIVQAIEDPDRAFYMGVQFHPEFLIYRKKFRRIFEALVDAARDYRGNHQAA